MHFKASLLATAAMAASAQAVWPFKDSDAGPQPTGTPKVARAAFEPPVYNGTEYKWGPLKYRPSLLPYEPYIVLGFIVLFLYNFVGNRQNKSQAKAWYNAHRPYLAEQFAMVGVKIDDEFAQDGGAEWLGYASGRRGCERCEIKLVTKPRQDLVAQFYHFARKSFDLTYDDGAGKVAITFSLLPPKGTPHAKYVFAVVSKENMKLTRLARWDLQTFSNLVDTPLLPNTLVVMSESGDITNSFLKLPAASNVGMIETFGQSEEQLPGLKYFESLIISDMPSERPDEEKPTLPNALWTITLNLRLPTDRKEMASTVPLLALATNLIDVLYERQQSVPHVTIEKAKTRRVKVLEKLTEEIRKEIKEQEEEERLEKKYAAEKAKLDKMKPEERKKYEQKKRDKDLRKAQMKQVKRK